LNQEKSITGAPAAKVRTSLSAMVHTVEASLHQYISMRKKPARLTFAVASIRRTSHTATGPTGLSKGFLYLLLARKDLYFFLA
jgi:hypothetical protein